MRKLGPKEILAAKIYALKTLDRQSYEYVLSFDF